MRTFTHRFFLKTLSTLSFALPLLVGCGPEQAVHSSVQITDRSTKALSLGSFMEVNGTYGAGCTARTGSWSVGIDGFSGLTNPPLTVLTNDLGCVLSATSLRVGGLLSSNLFIPPASITLGSSFASSGSAFVKTDGDPVDFYGNMKIQPDLSFATDFNISLVFSQDPNLVSANANATAATQSATAAGAGVEVPDYTIDVTGIAMQVDSNKVVQSVSGNAVLGAMSVAGQTFVVSFNDLGAAPTYAMLDTEFQLGTQQSLTGLSPLISAADFSLMGVSLATAQVRTVIVANSLSGIRSYEAFRIMFSAP